MARTRPSTSGLLTDGAKLGLGGDTFKLYPLRLRGSLTAGDFWDTTSDRDDANTAATVPFNYWDKDFVFAGVMVGGSAVGFASLGASDAGVAVTMTFQNGHTLTGNLIVQRVVFDQDRKGSSIPLVFIGRGVGTWTEAHA